jgi:transposase InsO family protein
LQSFALAMLLHIRSLAGYIIDMLVSSFWKRQPPTPRCHAHRHGRRQLLWCEVTRHPTAEWLARQITEAFPWISAPAYLMRDNDGAYGHVFTSRVRAMGIRDRPISPGSPRQNGYAERLIGTVCHECLDRMLIFGEQHLRRIFLLTRHITINRARTYR